MCKRQCRGSAYTGSDTLGKTPKPGDPKPAGEDLDLSFIMGTPEQAADQVAELRDLGIRNLMLKLNTGEMESRHVRASMRLFGEKVLPLFR